MGKLDDNVTIIIRAVSGFGRATTILFGKEGAKVVVAERAIRLFMWGRQGRGTKNIKGVANASY